MKWKNWTARYEPPEDIYGISYWLKNRGMGATIRKGEEMGKLAYALVERGPQRIQTVVQCPEHGDDCEYIAGTCPDMQSKPCGFGLCTLGYVFDTEPIEASAIEYVEGVTGGRNVIAAVSEDDTPAILLGCAQ